MGPALPTARERCSKMGTLGKDGSNPLIFDGRPESWPLFKKALHQFLDKEGYGWVAEGGDAFCAMLQAAASKARDIWKRHSLNKCRGLREERPPSVVRKRVGNNIRTAGTDREP